MKKNKQNFREMEENFKCINGSIQGRKGQKYFFEKLKTSQIICNTLIYTFKMWKKLSILNAQRSTSRPIIVEMLEDKDKEQILKTHTREPIRFMADFPSET